MKCSQLEALILEASLIKKHLPKYNILLKDDKSHIYIVIDKGNVTKDGKTVSVPRVLLARERDLETGTTFYGPFTSAEAAKAYIKLFEEFSLLEIAPCLNLKNIEEQVGHVCMVLLGCVLLLV